MKTSTFFKPAILCIALGFMTFTLGAQTIITADNNPGSTAAHTTAQSAVDAATAGDIIYLQPSGTSYGNLLIEKAITIVGRSHSEPGKKSMLSAVYPVSSNITLKGLEISNISPSIAQANAAPTPPPFSGINILECRILSTFYIGTTSYTTTTAAVYDDIVVRGCVLDGQVLTAVNATDILLSNNIFSGSSPLTVYNPSSTVVANNIFRYWSTPINITNAAPSSTLLLFNNMFIFTYSGNSPTFLSLNNGDFNLTNNLTYSTFGKTVDISANSTGSFIDSFTKANLDPEFTNVDSAVSQSFADNSSYIPGTRLEDDLTLQSTSPALTGGGGGSQIGLYNNGFLYNILGNPNGIPTLDVISYDGAVEKNSSINVTINAEAH